MDVWFPRGRAPLLLACVVAFPLATNRPEVTTAGETVEALVLPPYLESVVFDLFSEGRETAVEVFAPDSPDRPLAAGVDGVEEIRVGEILRTLIVRRPAPGRWLFRKPRPESRVKIRSQQFFPRGALVEPAGGEPVRQDDQVLVAYRVTDENGAPLEELPGYPLSAEVVLVGPQGLRLSLGMERQPQRGPGVFRTRRRAPCNLPGRYWTEVVLTARDLTGQKVRVLQDRWSGFSVRPSAVPQKPLGHFRPRTVSFLVSRTKRRPFGRWR